MSFARTVKAHTTLTAALIPALALLLVVAVLLCNPALHVLLGVDVADAFDQGIMLPKHSANYKHVIPVAALFLLATTVVAKTLHDADAHGRPVRSAEHAGTSLARRTSHFAMRVAPADDASDGGYHAYTHRSSAPPARPHTRHAGGLLVLPVIRHEGGIPAHPQI